MIVQPKSPCRVRYRRRAASSFRSRYGQAGPPVTAAGGCPVQHAKPAAPAEHFRIVVDRQLCQGHAMCMGEAPDLFRVDESGELHLLQESPPLALLERARQAARYCPNQAIRVETLTEPSATTADPG